MEKSVKNWTIIIVLVICITIAVVFVICLYLPKTQDNNPISLTNHRSDTKANDLTKDTYHTTPSKEASTAQKLNASKLLLQESMEKCLLKGMVVIKNTLTPVPDALIRCAESKYSIYDLEDKKSPTKYNDKVHMNTTDEKGNFAFSL